MSAADLDLIDILTNHIKWAGKYPVPRGDKAEWNQHVERMDAALTEPDIAFSIPLLRRNERLFWDDYSRLWDIGYSRYWELHQQDHG